MIDTVEKAKKFINCADCGISIEFRGGRHIRCENCARLVRNAKAAAKWKTNPQVRPKRFVTCSMCGNLFKYWSHKTVCEECRPIQEKATADEWARNNREKVNDTARRYRERHATEIAERRPIARIKYRKQEREYSRSSRRHDLVNKWEKEKRAKDPAFDISKRISHQIRLAIKENKAGRQWEELVGYGLEDLTTHIERQFLPGMSWDNRNEWHIDHIVPQASFEFSDPDDDDFKTCWALTNLRPLWADKNMSKSDKRIFLI